MYRIIGLFICCWLLLAAPLAAQKIATTARLKTTFETLELPEKEKMGLLGGSFLYDATDWLAIGGSSYGAVTGERGGFITLGLTAELRKKLTDNAEINTGIFLGAGGGRGGYTLQGGGLMLRYHLGGQYTTQDWGNLGAGVSYVEFPNGNIDSFQPYISYEYPFETLLTSGWLPDHRAKNSVKNPLSTTEQEFSTVYTHYDVPTDVLADDGNPQHKKVELTGVEWIRYLNKNLFIKIESAGAMGGESNGYMQLLLGGGGRVKLLDNTALKLAAAAGYAGGGNIATGGGVLLNATASLQQYLGKHWFGEIAAGYTQAPDGDFEATILQAKLGYRFHTPDASNILSKATLATLNPSKLRIRTVHQTYTKAATGWRNHHADENVNLLGFQLDNFLNDNVYLSGQGIAAYQGNAGGYMTGLVGGGVHLPLLNIDSPLYLELETLIGAAGGGGLDVAGGLVYQGNVNLGYHLSETYSVIGTCGYMSAPKGNFRAYVIGASLAYRFNLFTVE